MDSTFFEQAHAEGVISDASFAKMQSAERNRLFSLHWELKTLLYLGVLLCTTGIGVLVYKNIDTIGHRVLIIFAGFCCAAGFVYCFLHKPAFSPAKVESPGIFFDYVLLFSGLLLIVFIGYWQFEYNLFGDHPGIAGFVPMAILFITAYLFDHLGILSLAITNLAAWAGIAVTPLEILKQNDFNDTTIILTGIVLGVGLMAANVFTEKKDFKKHFAFTYLNFGMHLLFISILAALFSFDQLVFLVFLLFAAVVFYFYREAISSKSFYLVVTLSIYGYIGLSYLILHLLFGGYGIGDGGIYLALFYFIGSAIGFVLFLIHMNKKIKAGDRL